ncbi:MAG: tetratricopeptide repeat protein, partial [Chloroflexota bacterium]
MSAEMAQKLVQGGIKAVRDGKPDLARKAFTQALKLDPQSEVAWLGMATITEDPDDKRRILERVLSINPDNERAATALAQLSPDEPEPEFITGSDPIRETNAFSAAIDDIDEAKLADTGELSLDIEDPPLPEAEEEFDDEGIPLPPMFDMDDTEEEFDDEGIPLPPMFG